MELTDSHLSNVPTGCKTVIFGGTFDPPHRGHLWIVNQLLKTKRFELIVIAVTTQNPLKESRATPLELRLEMLGILLKAESLPLTQDPKGSGVYISDIPYSYTYEFVDYWRKNFSSQVAWAIGEDLKEEFLSGREWQRLNLPLVILPELAGFRSTRIRQGQLPPHPALTDFIAQRRLYYGDRA